MGSRVAGIAGVIVLALGVSACAGTEVVTSTSASTAPGTTAATDAAADAEGCGPSRYPGAAHPSGRPVPAVTTSSVAVASTASTPKPAAGFAAQAPSTTFAPVRSAVGSPTTAASPGAAAQIGQDQGALQQDFFAAEDYGVAHRDEYGSAWWDNGGPVMIVVSFTGHLDEHRAAIAKLVAHPDQVRVEQACRTDVDLHAIRDQIDAAVTQDGRHALRSLGVNGQAGRVNVWLAANGESLARGFHERYGRAVSLMVGNWPYPYSTTDFPVPTVPHDPSARCPLPFEQWYALQQTGAGRPGPAIGTLPGLSQQVVIETPPTEPGGGFSGHDTFTNNGPGPVTVDEHALFAIVVDAEHRVVAVASGARTADLRVKVLQPGERHDVPLVGDTGTCVPDAGYTLAPGTYGVIVAPTVTYTTSPGGMADAAGTVVVSPETPLTIR